MKKNKEKDKLFIVRKYIMAKSAKDAIRKDKLKPVDDVWVDEKWKDKQLDQLPSAIGFDVEVDNE